MNRRKFLSLGALGTAAGLYAAQSPLSPAPFCKSPVCSWYLPAYLNDAPNNLSINVRDTDSALGRYNHQDNIKKITIDDVVKFHGHLCDGLVFSYLQISVALQKLFPDGIVDRTDLAGACKNSPCMVDTLSYVTGAKINFKTLRIDPTLGASHIVHRISTKETYKVQLATGVFPDQLAKLEGTIRSKVAANEPVPPAYIDEVEKLADSFIHRLLHTPLEQLVNVEKLEGYLFVANESVDVFGKRGDIVNRNVYRQ